MSLLALIPGLPLAAFLLLALAGRRWEEVSHRIAVPAVLGSFLASVGALVMVSRGGPIDVDLYQLFAVGDFVVDVGLHVDALAVFLLILVTGVSFVVHVYSARYMTGDPRYRRFFALTCLFTAAMAMLVLSSNLLVTYMCWELMGICSYLLISHRGDRLSAARAATKAFLVNAVADVGLGAGVVLTALTYGTLDIQSILGSAAGMSGAGFEVLGVSVQTNTVIALCLLCGALGKSAQVPMHAWLPHAMEAPTPVSALIHAATMVNAGPFLLARFSPLVVLVPNAMAVIAVIGAVTALYGAMVSVTQSDIKKLLAYSTISQIGFMVFACGIGAFSAAMFHLVAHGFLKGFLFLSTGNALTAAVHGHARVEMPARRLRSLAVGALPIVMVPPVVLFAGPYERLWASEGAQSATVAFWVIAVATTFLTALFVFRGIVALFGSAVGRGVAALPRLGSPSHLVYVAVATAAVGASLMAAWSWTADFLSPVLGDRVADPYAPGPTSWLAVPLVAALAGWAWAYREQASPSRPATASSPLVRAAYVHLLNRLYFDEIYRVGAVQPVLRLSDWLLRRIDIGIVERLIHGLGSVAAAIATWLLRVVDLGGADALPRRIARLLEEGGEALRRLSPSTLQQHQLLVVFWLVVAIALSYWTAG